MNIEKERAAFEAWYCGNYTGLKQSDLVKFRTLSGYSFGDPLKIDVSWEAWQAAKAQAAIEIDDLKAQLKAAHESRAEFVEYCNVSESSTQKKYSL